MFIRVTISTLILEIDQWVIAPRTRATELEELTGMRFPCFSVMNCHFLSAFVVHDGDQDLFGRKIFGRFFHGVGCSVHVENS